MRPAVAPKREPGVSWRRTGEMFPGQLEAIARYVDSVGTDGLYEIVGECTT